MGLIGSKRHIGTENSLSANLYTQDPDNKAFKAISPLLIRYLVPLLVPPFFELLYSS